MCMQKMHTVNTVVIILLIRKEARSGCGAAAVGATTRGSADRLIASTSPQASGTATWAFASFSKPGSDPEGSALEGGSE
jgi:hypothetical protein